MGMMGKIMALNINALNIITVSGNTSYKDYIYDINLWPHFTDINKDFLYHFTLIHSGKGFAQLLLYFLLNRCFDLLQSHLRTLQYLRFKYLAVILMFTMDTAYS